MLRICGILLLSAIPVGIGWIRSRHTLKEQDEIRAALFLVTQFRQGIAYCQLPIVDIVRQLPRNQYDLVDNLSMHFHAFAAPKDAWNAASKKISCHHIVDIMRNLFDSLGVSDRVSQLQICDMTIERLRAIQTEISGEIMVRSKLSRTIGLLAGAFLAIILL